MIFRVPASVTLASESGQAPCIKYFLFAHLKGSKLMGHAGSKNYTEENEGNPQCFAKEPSPLLPSTP